MFRRIQYISTSSELSPYLEHSSCSAYSAPCQWPSQLTSSLSQAISVAAALANTLYTSAGQQPMALSRIVAGMAAFSAAAGLYTYDHVRQNVSETAVPSDSLLANVALRADHKDVYIDAFETTVYAPLAATSTSSQAAAAEDEAALQLLARSFFSSPAFWPEKALLRLLAKPSPGSDSTPGKGPSSAATGSTKPEAGDAGAANVQQMAFQAGDTVASGRFSVAQRRPQEVLLEWELRPSFRGATWLSVQRPTPFKYQLQLGSAVWGEGYDPAPQSLTYKAHRLYSKVLLYSARRTFERALISSPSGLAHAEQ